MLAIAHDYRIMRSDRCYYCFPEVDIRIPFTPGMAALIQAKLSPQTAVTAMTTGHRYGGLEAKAAALVDATASESELIDVAVERIAALGGKDSGTLGAIKNTMHGNSSGPYSLRAAEPSDHTYLPPLDDAVPHHAGCVAVVAVPQPSRQLGEEIPQELVELA